MCGLLELPPKSVTEIVITSGVRVRLRLKSARLLLPLSLWSRAFVLSSVTIRAASSAWKLSLSTSQVQRRTRPTSSKRPGQVISQMPVPSGCTCPRRVERYVGMVASMAVTCIFPL